MINMQKHKYLMKEKDHRDDQQAETLSLSKLLK